MKFLGSFLLGFFVVLTVPQAYSAGFFEEKSGLLFNIPDQYTIRDVSPEQDSSTRAFTAGPSAGVSIIEIRIEDDSLSKVLEELQLRTISSTQLSNREVLSTTGVEVTGSTYIDQRPAKALIFISNDLTISVVYKGGSDSEYEKLLESIQKSTGFPDTISHPLSTEIQEVAERNIFSGYKEGNNLAFKPQQTINRAEFLKVLVLSQSGNTEQSVASFFSKYKTVSKNQGVLPDVDREAWFAPYIFYAFDRGWVKGYPDGTFKPGNTLNIAEAAKILLESRGVVLTADSEVWFRPYMSYFADSAILTPAAERFRFSFTDEQFNTYDFCTRAQAAGFIARLLFLDEHPGLETYGRLTPPEGLDFTFRNEEATEILEVGTQSLSRNHKSYDFFKKIGSSSLPISQILVYYPEEWTELERLGILHEQNVVYLGENKSAIYAVRSICQGEVTCVNGLKEWFSIKNQDLKEFQDLNIGFEFLHHEGVQFEKILEPELETVIVKKDSTQQLVILSFFKGESSPFTGQSPVYKATIGNREWSVFKEVVKGVSRLSLMTSFEAGVMVASIPNIDTFSKIDPKVFRILRSLDKR